MFSILEPFSNCWNYNAGTLRPVCPWHRENEFLWRGGAHFWEECSALSPFSNSYLRKRWFLQTSRIILMRDLFPPDTSSKLKNRKLFIANYPKFCIGLKIRKSRCRTTLRLRFGYSKWFSSAALHGVIWKEADFVTKKGADFFIKKKADTW